jgi:excisionase family DNA binding protein
VSGAAPDTAALPTPDRYSCAEAIAVERKTISIMKACELVGVSRRTIYNWLSSGKVEYVRTAGGSVRIFVETLWREPHRAEQPQPAAPPAVEAGSWQPQERNQS